MNSSWVQLFKHPLFRKAWADHRMHKAWSEEEADNVVYIFGRLMAAESRSPLPRYSEHLSQEIIDVIRKCPAFEKQMVVAQWLQTHGDPTLMDQELGVKQGDGT